MQLQSIINWLNPERLKKVSDVILDQQRAAKDTHDFNDWSTQLEVMFDDSNETVCDNRRMYLYTNGVLGLTLKSFNSKMLLEPLEATLTHHLLGIFVST
jgi:hypothetical protein